MTKDKIQYRIAQSLFAIIGIVIFLLAMGLFFIWLKNPSLVIDYSQFQAGAHLDWHTLLEGLRQFNLYSLLDISLLLVVISQAVRVFSIAMYFLIHHEHWLMVFSWFILAVLLHGAFM